MNQLFENLNSLGYSDCFYQNGKLWGFHHQEVMPKPIPQEVIIKAESDSQRDRLFTRLELWFERRGIRRS